MNRFETTIVALAAFAVAAVHAPAFGQYVIFDGKESGEVKQAPTEVKNGRISKSHRKKAPAPAVPPQPKEPTFTATGGFESTKEKARESAIRAAVDKFHEYLGQQSPPIERMPSDRRCTELIRDKMLLNDQEKVAEQQIEIDGKQETMYKITVAVRVEPDQVRSLRSHERASEALWVLAGLGGLAGVFAVFFRIDAWTKGYLTSWLVLGTVGTATLLGGLWWLAK
jgi:hypothetical protein